MASNKKPNYARNFRIIQYVIIGLCAAMVVYTLGLKYGLF